MAPILFDGIAFRFFTAAEVADYFAGTLPRDFVVIVTPLRVVPPEDAPIENGCSLDT